MKLTLPLLVATCIAHSASITWSPTATATFDHNTDTLFSDSANWNGGVLPGSSDSIVFDISNTVADGTITNTNNIDSASFNVAYLNLDQDYTLSAGQSLVISGTSSVADMAYFGVNSGATLDVYGTIDLDANAGSYPQEVLGVQDGGTMRIHSGASIDADYILISGTVQYVITSLSDTFNITSSDNTHFEFANANGLGISLDLTGFSGTAEELLGASYTLFDGHIGDSTYDDSYTRTVGVSSLGEEFEDIRGTVTQSGTGDGTFILSFISIPEPSSTLLLSLGGLALVTRRKR